VDGETDLDIGNVNELVGLITSDPVILRDPVNVSPFLKVANPPDIFSDPVIVVLPLKLFEPVVANEPV
jgi:hypothetical protein